MSFGGDRHAIVLHQVNDQAAFTYARSVLVVVVSILVALFGRSPAGQKAVESVSVEPEQPATAMVQTKVTEDSPKLQQQQSTVALPEQAANVDRSPDAIAQASSQSGYVALDDGATVAIANG